MGLFYDEKVGNGRSRAKRLIFRTKAFFELSFHFGRDRHDKYHARDSGFARCCPRHNRATIS